MRADVVAIQRLPVATREHRYGDDGHWRCFVGFTHREPTMGLPLGHKVSWLYALKAGWVLRVV